MNDTSTGARRSPVRYIGAGIALIAFLGLYATVLQNFRDSGERKAGAVTLGHGFTDGVNIAATVLSVDPIKGEMLVRLAFEPVGNLSNDGTLTKDLSLIVSAGSGNVERPFKKGKIMPPTDVTLELFDGQVTNYPFDRFKAELFVAMETAPPASTTTSGSSSSPSEAPTPTSPATSAEPPEAVPVSMFVFESLHGFKIDIENRTEEDDGTVDALIRADRATSTVVFAVFVMILMWLLAVGALALALTVSLGGRKVELAMFGFLGSLLFAFPAVRNVIPGTPPIGSLNDYIAFFWCEAIVAVSLLIILAVWIFRRPA